MLPINTVEQVGFKGLLQKFKPRYHLPSRSYFSRVAIQAIVREVKNTTEQQIASGELNFFPTTTDLWTSTARDPYLSYTCHFVNQEWEIMLWAQCTSSS